MSSNLLYGYGVSDAVVTLVTTGGYNVTQDAEEQQQVIDTLGRELEFRLSQVVQEALKFMKQSKRCNLTYEDVNNALRLRNIEGLYGIAPSSSASKGKSPTALQFQAASPEVYYIQDKELHFDEVLEAELPIVPKQVALGVHWLAVNGMQPHIPENPLPPPSVDTDDAKTKDQLFEGNITQALKHVLSKELQLYLERVTSTIKGDDDEATRIALAHIKQDTGHQQLVPYFIQFITEEVAANLRNLRVLKALMSLARSLLENPSLNLHQLMPAILTCLVGRRLCERPNENHWELRDYSADLIGYICNRYGNTYTSLQPRISKTLAQAFLDPSKPLTTHYGAVVGLTKLGHQVVKLLVIPHVKDYLSLLSPELANTNHIRQMEAKKCYDALLVAAGNYAQHPLSVGTEDSEALTSAWDNSIRELSEAFGEDFAPFVVSKHHPDHKSTVQ